MSLTIKHSFKFLNTPCFRLKNMIVGFARQGFQVARAVIILNTIQVMNNPSLRQRSSMCLFPNKDMLKDITFLVRSWMTGFEYAYIAQPQFNFTTLPMDCLLGESLLMETRITAFRSRVAMTTTINAGMPLIGAITAASKSRFAWVFCPFRHSNSIAGKVYIYKHTLAGNPKLYREPSSA